jgi:uroporphyrinogen-III synthase
LGFEPLISPLITIQYQHDLLLQPQACDGYIFTSRFGVKGLSNPDITKPCFVVGESTALAAKKQGFKDIYLSLDHVAGIEPLIKQQGIKGKLLYASADHITRPIMPFEKVLVERFIVYHTELVSELTHDVYALNWSAALFFSKRTAAHFCDLLGGQNAANTLRSKKILCLSAAVASVFHENAYTDVRIAESPTRQSMLNLLGKMS